jgi:predicted membrane protein
LGGEKLVRWHTFVKAPVAHLVVFTAITAALGYLLNMIAIPVGPHINLVFGEIVTALPNITVGPLWGVIAHSVASVYTIILWGHASYYVAGIPYFIAMAALSRRIRPFWSIMITLFVVYFPLMWWYQYYIVGYPVWLLWWIIVKRIANTAFNAFIIEAMLGLPIVQKVIPGWKAPEKVGFFFWKRAPET